MGSILGGIAIALVIAICAGFVLDSEQKLSWQVYSSQTSTRVGDPGDNLVGPTWNGENNTTATESM